MKSLLFTALVGFASPRGVLAFNAVQSRSVPHAHRAASQRELTTARRCCRCHPAIASAAVNPAAAGQDVARWCVAAGREQATVAVSGSSTLAGVMADFWLVARSLATEEGPVGRQRILALPAWDAVRDAQFFQKVLGHINECSEICEYLGESLLVVGRHPSYPTNEDEPDRAPCPMLLLRSFSQAAPGDYAAENGEEDPFASMNVDDRDLFASARAPVGPLTSSEALASTQVWVEGLVPQLGMAADERADDLSYVASSARTGEQAYEDFWRQVSGLKSPDGPSAAMLLTPSFARYNWFGYELFQHTLNGALGGLGLGAEVQLVFFHPEFPLEGVGGDREGVGAQDVALGIDFARQSPHPMVSLLRTECVDQMRRGVQSSSACTAALIEIHERLCGPEGGLMR